MPNRPRDIWGSLSPEIQTQVIEGMSSILMEAIDEKLGAGNHSTSGPKGRDLRPPVHPAPGTHQPGEPQAAVRPEEKRATELGWRADDVQVIDSDLGFTGSEASHREGFKELTARVTLGQVGIVLSSEVTRLSRNCSDWCTRS